MADPIPYRDDINTKRQLFYECFGTFTIVYCGGLAVLQEDLKHHDITALAMGHFMVVFITVYSGAGVSGAHYNGA